MIKSGKDFFQFKTLIKPPDIVIIILGVMLTVYPAIALSRDDAARVLIRGPGQSWVFPLNTEETVIVKGNLGDTIVRIHGNEAWVESSPCENKTCVITGHIRKYGAWSACLPNGVLIAIEGKESEEVPDAVAW
jgi:hypothetical protein